MTAIVKRIALLAALAVVVVTARAQFGSYSHDLPFMGVVETGGSGPADGFTWTNNLIFRFDADTFTNQTDGAAVTYLEDISTNTLDVTSGGTHAPYYTNNSGLIGGKGWIQFGQSAATRLTNYSGKSYSQPLTFFFVARQPSGGSYPCAFSSRTTVFHWNYNSGGSAHSIYAGAGLTWSAAEDPPTSSAFHVWVLVYNGASSRMWANSKPVGVTENAGNNAFGPITLGIRGDTLSDAANWPMAYGLGYSGTVDGATQTNIVNWLANRFSLSTL